MGGKLPATYLISFGFAGVVGMAILKGLPISYVVMRRWFNDFAYRIDLAPGYFIGSAFVIFLIAVLTIGVQSVRAWLSKPVEACQRPKKPIIH